MGKYFSARNIASFYIFAMGTQFIAYEGFTVSPFKVALMAITPLLWLIMCPRLTKATFYSVLYLVITVFCLYIQSDNVRSSTLWYTSLFFSMFNMYYAFVYTRNVFSLDYFIKLLKYFIYAYAGCLFLQQVLFITGIKYVPIINLNNMHYYEAFRLNTLAIEPSHAARLLTVTFYILLECLRLKKGRLVSFSELLHENKRTCIAFIYTMICMGSGTAFVGLAILSLYFIKKDYILIIIPTFVLAYLAVEFIDYEPLNRARNVFLTAVTGDTEELTRVDSSAASRANIIINTIKYFDITNPRLWYGYGIDSGHLVASGISDYGLLSYIPKLMLFWGCCFPRFFSLPTIMFVILFSFNIGNIAYGWTCLMMFSTLKYFELKYSNT